MLVPGGDLLQQALEEVDVDAAELARQPEMPAVAGLVMGEIMPRLSPSAGCLFERGFGDAADHPLTPFPALGSGVPRGSGSWSSSVWRREQQG